MTYIVGIRIPERNFLTIISDIMVTYEYSDGRIEKENSALKVGRLFDGCLYGLAGDATCGHEFLVAFKKSIDFKDKTSSNFNKLCEYVSSSGWDSGQGFNILFGVRNPTPEFYLLDSKTRKIELIEESMHTMGSGKGLLDKIVLDAYEHSTSHILSLLDTQGASVVYYPSFFSLWLSELVLGFEETQLNEIGVGGVFHYVYQTETNENSSMPLIIVLSKLINDRLMQTSYRISLVNGYLILENLKAKTVSAFSSKVERIDLAEIGLLADKDILQEAYKRSHELPIYYFCGFASHDPSYRGFYTAHFSANDTKVIDWDGNVRADFQEKILRNIKETRNKYGTA